MLSQLRKRGINMENKRLIELVNVSKDYDGDVALNNINLYIRDGEFLTLLGPSGCGKTTLLRLIAGFIMPSSGKIMMDGKELTNVPPYKRRVNTVFQKYALFSHLNVFENVAFGLKIRKLPKDEIKRRVTEMLELVNLAGYEKRYIDQLSGGQQQRVAIARALVNEPEVLLLDEPLGALDLKLRKEMQIELKRMQKKLGITFIFVTHDQEEAINMSDTIAVMNHGRFEQIGTPDEIYNHPKTSYVATFVGNANILTGVVENIGTEETGDTSKLITVRTDAGKVKVSMNNANITAESDKEYLLQKGEKVTIAVRSENIRFEENNDCDGLNAEVIEKTFAGGQLRVVLKTSEGQEIVASRYGIDTNVSVGEKVRCCFLPTDAVLVDRGGTNA